MYREESVLHAVLTHIAQLFNGTFTGGHAEIRQPDSQKVGEASKKAVVIPLSHV